LKGLLGFLTVFLSITGAGTYYIFVRASQAFSLDGGAQLALGLALFFLLVSYILAVTFERTTSLHWLNDTLHRIGAAWLFLLAYFFLSVLAVDIVRLFDLVFGFLPERSSIEYQQLKPVAGWVVIGVVAASFIVGFINARVIRMKRLSIDIAKRADKKQLKVLVASDLHLGVMNGIRRTKYYVDKINEQQPDLVLIPGDIMDGPLAPVERRKLGEILAQMRSKHGVYAVTGNHEYIGSVEPSVRYLEQFGITFLRDEVTEVAGVQIVGREDRSNRYRKPFAELITELDRTKPIVMLDHQPFHLEEAEQAGVDLQLSGHTHHGQFWPINLITSRIYEVSWGYKQKGSTHVYVSCGAGTWGPPVRIGSRSEMIVMDIAFA
jgi:uncharacterized protein